MMQKKIRMARPGDAAILGEMARNAYTKYPHMKKGPEPVFYDYSQVIAEAETWVLECDGRACGMVTLVVKADHLLVKNLAILPEFQRHGIGHFALAYAESEARRLHKERVCLWTNVHVPDNVLYYQSAGYSETHREDRDDYRFIHMAKTIESSAPSIAKRSQATGMHP
jgi:N-acetylglutamate synthase-like GNAT family acetyltransferase